jgi:arginine/ornithine N-succinyltransferase beta subunit
VSLAVNNGLFCGLASVQVDMRAAERSTGLTSCPSKTRRAGKALQIIEKRQKQQNNDDDDYILVVDMLMIHAVGGVEKVVVAVVLAVLVVLEWRGLSLQLCCCR